jgi:DNA-binding HxlR family transcriptional regulator
MAADNEQFLRDLYNMRYLFADKWAPAINVTLSHGPMRRAEILSTIKSYSLDEEWSDKNSVLHDSILARTLKKMTEEGLLVRTRDTETFPPKAFYSLRPEVVEFVKLVEPLVEWVRRNPDLIAKAQARSRRNNDETGTLTELDIIDEDDEESGPEDSHMV